VRIAFWVVVAVGLADIGTRAVGKEDVDICDVLEQVQTRKLDNRGATRALKEGRVTVEKRRLVDLVRKSSFNDVSNYWTIIMRCPNAAAWAAYLDGLSFVDRDSLAVHEQARLDGIHANIAGMSGMPAGEDLKAWLATFGAYLRVNRRVLDMVWFELDYDSCVARVPASQWGEMSVDDRASKLSAALAGLGMNPGKWQALDAATRVPLCKRAVREEKNAPAVRASPNGSAQGPAPGPTEGKKP